MYVKIVNSDYQRQIKEEITWIEVEDEKRRRDRKNFIDNYDDGLNNII